MGDAQAAQSGDGPVVGKQRKPDNSCITFLANIGIIVLVVVNILSLLLGIGIIVVGRYVDKEVDKHDNVMDLFDKIDFDSFTLAELINALIVLIFIVGAFAIVTSLIGGFGAFFTLRIMLIVYIIIIVLVIIVELVILSLWIELLQQVDNSLKGLFDKLLKEYTGFADISVYTVGWDFVFVLFECCGVRPVTTTYNDFEVLPSVFWSSTSRGSDVIPHACCQDVTIDNYLSYNNTDCTVNLQDYNTSGCYDFFDDLFTRLGSAAVSIATLLVLVEVGAIFFSVIIIVAVSMKKRPGIV